MTEEELEEIIEKARIDRVSELNLRYKQLSRLPDSIGSIHTLKRLDLTGNELTKLPVHRRGIFIFCEYRQKKTQKTPKKELERAKKYLEDFIERNTESIDKQQED